MRIGIGIPSIFQAPGTLMLEWARRAEAGPFSTLGITDRLVDSNYDPMVALAAAAGATHRIRLMSTVILAPLHNAGVLAKQALSLDALSGGRFTLGLGLGGRELDYATAPAPFEARGKRFEEQLAHIRRIFAGELRGHENAPMGPPPARASGPGLICGAISPVAARRIGRYADGFIAAALVGDPGKARAMYEIVLEVWQAEGRPGWPCFVGNLYFGLGPNGPERVHQALSSYYTFLGPKALEVSKHSPGTVEALRDAMGAFESIGMDELILHPCIGELEQIDRLADVVG